MKFQHADGGLMAKSLPSTFLKISADPSTATPLVRNSPGGEVVGFAVCGEDHKWQWTTAKIEGSTVVLSSPDVPKPVAVRYAWAQNPFCNLYNTAGLPAGPFRTDDFPMASKKNHYGPGM